jgi:hypothetical protein
MCKEDNMALTRKHYRWLASEISPMVENKELFISKVREMSDRNFNIYKFRDACEEAYLEQQAEDCGPDLYKLDDHIPN